jgi:hypothetical protein
MPQAIIPTSSKVSPSASSFTTLFAKTTSKLLQTYTHITNINHCKVLHVESWKLKISQARPVLLPVITLCSLHIQQCLKAPHPLYLCFITPSCFLNGFLKCA